MRDVDQKTGKDLVPMTKPGEGAPILVRRSILSMPGTGGHPCSPCSGLAVTSVALNLQAALGMRLQWLDMVPCRYRLFLYASSPLAD